MRKTFAEKIIHHNRQLRFSGNLPKDFMVLNPFADNPETFEVTETFYRKYYCDNNSRKFIIGINPGRHGAGVTGVPFTDTRRLKSECGIEMKTVQTYEVSSVFIYDMIEAFGGVDLFYKDFFINSLFPLAIVRHSKKGELLNANYYDDSKLFEAVKPFMIESMKKNIQLGLNTEVIYILGKKNAVFIQRLNKEAKFFDRAVVLEHPRYIQQYKSKEKKLYIDKYIMALNDSVK